MRNDISCTYYYTFFSFLTTFIVINVRIFLLRFSCYRLFFYCCYTFFFCVCHKTTDDLWWGFTQESRKKRHFCPPTTGVITNYRVSRFTSDLRKALQCRKEKKKKKNCYTVDSLKCTLYYLALFDYSIFLCSLRRVNVHSPLLRIRLMKRRVNIQTKIRYSICFHNL